MRSNKKTQAGRVWYAWTGVGKGMLLVLRLVNTRGEQEGRTMEGSRSEGLVSSQFQNQFGSVPSIVQQVNRFGGT